MGREDSMATWTTATIHEMATEGRCPIAEPGHSSTSMEMKLATVKAMWVQPTTLLRMSTVAGSRAAGEPAEADGDDRGPFTLTSTFKEGPPQDGWVFFDLQVI